MGAPEWLWPVLASPFIGSFLGVLVTRLPHGRPIVIGRSACDHCGHALGPADLVPIASWLALRGRCRYCDAKITTLPLIIEVGAVLVAVWAASVSGGLALWAGCVLGWMLLTLAAIDFRDGILPDVLTLPLIALGLVATYFFGPGDSARQRHRRGGGVRDLRADPLALSAAARPRRLGARRCQATRRLGGLGDVDRFAQRRADRGGRGARPCPYHAPAWTGAGLLVSRSLLDRRSVLAPGSSGSTGRSQASDPPSG